MNKLLIAITSLTFFFTSCAIVKVGVGDASPTQATVEVGSQRNHFFIAGLVRGGKNDLKAEDFVGDRNGYVVKNKITFINGLVSVFTFGIYTPTTTSFHIPINQIDNGINLSDGKREIAEGGSEDDILINSETIKEPKKQNKRFLKTSKDKEQVENLIIEDIKIENNDSKTSRRRSKSRNDFDQLEKRSVRKPIIKEDKVILNEEETIVEIPIQEPIEKTYSTTQNTSSVNISKQAPRITESKPTISPNGYKAIIYFKNGAKMNGTVTEHTSGDLTIVLPGGSTIQSNMKEIEKIERR